MDKPKRQLTHAALSSPTTKNAGSVAHLHARGSMFFYLPRQLLALLALSCCLITVAAASVCADPRFAAQPIVQLGPMSIRSLVGNSTVRIQVLYSSTSASYVSIAIAKTPYMANAPATNAVVFDTSSASTFLAIIQSYESRDLPLLSDTEASLKPFHGGVLNGQISFTFERPLAAATIYDVPIDPSTAICIQWANSNRELPSKHSNYGSVNIVLGAPTVAAALANDGVLTSSTPAIAAITLALMVLYHKSVCAPAKHLDPWCTQPWANLKLGEAGVVLLYIACLVLVIAQVNNQFRSLPSSFFSSPSLGASTGSSSLARRTNGSSTSTAGSADFAFSRALHLIVVISNNTQLTGTAGYEPQQVVSLFGLLGFICFATMTVGAYEPFRRAYYNDFVLYHRVAAIIGIFFVMLHSRTVGNAMILPLAVYGLSFLARVVAAFANTATASTKPTTNCDDSPNSRSVLLTLPVTAKSTKWAQVANACAYFWVNIASVSLIEWHPFS
ncbi:hypothetical protein As57867_004186, partial [Aphanomyces stellatus]